ncbi:hypothetical protein JNUCC31_22030 [Paenibacillus sp. JNUCC31]|uniref:hypothetical protein n=1 Tax=Paenibacillus sp. JNUCC-31 TaxID=2777983 RepID=UPI00178718B7|nr:hypothetical protein [Paenibacillus sp. JNUCC-31]QOS77448.1 hypothetical protein JNUCC31_22030 [Paenibacillus sp. JNUCC-31]
MLKKIFIYVLGVSLGLSLFLSPHAIQAASVMSTLEYSNGSTYYGETQNGKPHGYGTMSWGKSKTYKGNWMAGKRSGQGVYKVVTRGEDSITELKYDGFWKNDKKEGKGELQSTETSLTGEMQEARIQTGTFTKDQWSAGYDVWHVTVADPPYSFIYKDSKMSLKILGDAGNILNGLKAGYFFSFTYHKGKVYKEVGVGDEYSPKQFSSFVKSVEKEIKPLINQFEKLAQQL